MRGQGLHPGHDSLALHIGQVGELGEENLQTTSILFRALPVTHETAGSTHVRHPNNWLKRTRVEAPMFGVVVELVVKEVVHQEVDIAVCLPHGRQHHAMRGFRLGVGEHPVADVLDRELAESLGGLELLEREPYGAGCWQRSASDASRGEMALLHSPPRGNLSNSSAVAVSRNAATLYTVSLGQRVD